MRVNRDWVVYYWREPCLWYRIIDKERAKKITGKTEPLEGICSICYVMSFLTRGRGDLLES